MDEPREIAVRQATIFDLDLLAPLFDAYLGAVRLTLSTEVTNEAAQALYETEGWTRQRDFYVYNLALDLRN